MFTQKYRTRGSGAVASAVAQGYASSQNGGSSSISFHLNGTLYTVKNGQFEFTTSLNDYIRDVAGFKGTKVMCREAGCGACVVTVTLYDPALHTDRTFSINSCLCPLYSVDGWQIVTVEGIGNQRQGFHPIQERVAAFNGSQCGYCTPGMVMNMYGFLHGKPTPTQEEVEGAFDGNICRCTGYRPILDAMKSFASDNNNENARPIDIEDLNKFVCPRSGKACANGSSVGNGASIGNGASHANGSAPTNGSHDRPDNVPLDITRDNVRWLRPDSLDALTNLLKKHQRDRLRMFFGNTSTGVYKIETPVSIYIDLHGIDELYKREVTDCVTIGANHSLSSLERTLGELSSQHEGYSYFRSLQEHILRIGNLPMRNAGSWAGNMMIKQAHNDFPSDLFVMMEAAGAHVQILDALRDSQRDYPMVEVMKMNMTGKVVLALKLFKQDDKDHFRSFKIMPRSQNAHAYVNAGFRFKLDGPTKQVLGKPSIVIGGISAAFNHAVKTENFLVGKLLQNADVVKQALAILQSELHPTADPVLGSPEYRRDLAVNLFYKFLLGVNRDNVSGTLASGADQLARPVSSGRQDFETKEDEFPLKKPIPKMLAPLQASGEAQYVNDIPEQLGELYGAFVLSTAGNAAIDSIDPAPALAMPGVTRFLSAKDIPGSNNSVAIFGKEEILASERVSFHAQPVGIILADSHNHAVAAAKLVKIKYKDVRPVIVHLKDAIAKEAFSPCPVKDLVSGDPAGAMESAPHTVSGEVIMGHQYHFFMENPVSLCCPNENSFDVYASTQWPDITQFVCADAIGKQANSINVSVARLGGAFGGKATRSFQISAAAAIGAAVTGRPVRMNMNLQDSMEVMGKRFPILAQYKVGFDDAGKLLAIDCTITEDCGYHSQEANFVGGEFQCHLDEGYYCPNWRVHIQFVKTNTAINTFCRAPGPVPAAMIIETIVEHVAKAVNRDPILVKEINLYEEGQSDHFGHLLNHCSIRRVWHELKTSADVERRQREIEAFNQANQWKKRGLAMTPLKYGLVWRANHFTSFVAIYKDGTVAVSQGGVEMGQGLFTKVAQAAAATLDIPVEFVKVKATNSLVSANNPVTGGSIGSELNVMATIECCKVLKERLAPFQAKGSDDPWQKVAMTAAFAEVDLTAKYTHKAPKPEVKANYFTYGAGVTECELDLLTGEQEILRLDALLDYGESLNPTVDVGQTEGCLVMGHGYWLSEHLMFDQKTGRLLNNGTWEYKPPTTKDIPIDMRISFLKDSHNPLGVLGSKATGEPPMVISTGAVFALKRAIEACRKDLNGDTSFFPIDELPLTVEKRQRLCGVSSDKLTL